MNTYKITHPDLSVGDRYIRVGNLKVAKFTNRIKVTGGISTEAHIALRNFTHKSTGIYERTEDGRKDVFIVPQMMFDFDLRTPRKCKICERWGNPEELYCEHYFSATKADLAKRRRAVKAVEELMGSKAHIVLWNNSERIIRADRSTMADFGEDGIPKNAGAQMFYRLTVPVRNDNAAIWEMYSKVMDMIQELTGMDACANGDMAKNPYYKGDAWEIEENPDAPEIDLFRLYKSLTGESAQAFFKRRMMLEGPRLDSKQIESAFHGFNFNAGKWDEIQDAYNSFAAELTGSVSESPDTLCPSEIEGVAKRYTGLRVDRVQDFAMYGRNNSIFSFLMIHSAEVIESVTQADLMELGLYEQCDDKSPLPEDEFAATVASVLSYKDKNYKPTRKFERKTTLANLGLYPLHMLEERIQNKENLELTDSVRNVTDIVSSSTDRYRKLRGVTFDHTFGTGGTATVYGESKNLSIEEIVAAFRQTAVARVNGPWNREYTVRTKDLEPSINYGKQNFANYSIAKFIINYGIEKFSERLGYFTSPEGASILWTLINQEYQRKTETGNVRGRSIGLGEKQDGAICIKSVEELQIAMNTGMKYAGVFLYSQNRERGLDYYGANFVTKPNRKNDFAETLKLTSEFRAIDMKRVAVMLDTIELTRLKDDFMVEGMTAGKLLKAHELKTGKKSGKGRVFYLDILEFGEVILSVKSILEAVGQREFFDMIRRGALGYGQALRLAKRAGSAELNKAVKSIQNFRSFIAFVELLNTYGFEWLNLTTNSISAHGWISQSTASGTNSQKRHFNGGVAVLGSSVKHNDPSLLVGVASSTGSGAESREWNPRYDLDVGDDPPPRVSRASDIVLRT